MLVVALPKLDPKGFVVPPKRDDVVLDEGNVVVPCVDPNTPPLDA